MIPLNGDTFELLSTYIIINSTSLTNIILYYTENNIDVIIGEHTIDTTGLHVYEIINHSLLPSTLLIIKLKAQSNELHTKIISTQFILQKKK